ncbi:hypothetical protein [Candidatus Albibeggiatoa sp. nov. BB20]|uniref:hypothetical protein n=1 Tax=Candidatus Albibeggiatoa sp. nov. BB20 TaxID=3162723 RepID=UPI00336563D1
MFNIFLGLALLLFGQLLPAEDTVGVPIGNPSNTGQPAAPTGGDNSSPLPPNGDGSSPTSTNGDGSSPTSANDDGSSPTSTNGDGSSPTSTNGDGSENPTQPDSTTTVQIGLLQTVETFDNTQLSLSISEAGECELSIANIETGEAYAGLSGDVGETDSCGTDQFYSSNVLFDAQQITNEGYFCFKTATNGYYGWGIHNCKEISESEFEYSDTGESIEIPIHKPPTLRVPEGLTEEFILDKTVAYGDKYFATFNVDSSRNYKLKYELKHAPVDTQLDSYNYIATWKAVLLGRFRFDVIVRELDAKFPQELILKASVNVLEYKLTDYDIEPEEIETVTAEKMQNLSVEGFQAFREPNIKGLRPEAFRSINAEQMAYMTYSAISAISIEQFSFIPPKSLRGIKAASLGGFSPQVLFEFTTEHINSLDPNIVFGRLPSEDTTKLVTNFDLRKISAKDINELLPIGWFFDGLNSVLIVPGGTPLAIKTLDDNPAPASRVNTPKLPKLDSGLALGGDSEEEDTILSHMNLALSENNLGQFKFAQNADGIVKVADESGLQFAFIPDNNSFSQQESDAESNIQIGQRNLNITTSESQSLSLIPAPKDMTALQNILPNGDITMGEKGDVIFDYANVSDNRGLREDEESDVVVVCEFDAFVETSSSDSDCESYDDYDIYACDDSFSDELGVQITRRAGRLTRAGEYQVPEGKMAYGDTTAQTIYPTIIEPSIFLTMLHQIDGLEDAEIYKNGSYLVTFNQAKYILQPDFTATATPLPKKGQLVPPAIHFREGGYLDYEVESNDIEYVQKVFINPYIE